MFLYDESPQKNKDQQNDIGNDKKNTQSAHDLTEKEDLQIVDLEQPQENQFQANGKPKRRQQRNMTTKSTSPVKIRDEENNKKNQDIDINKLQQIIQNGNNQEQIFEPGQDNIPQGEDLPVLEKLDGKFRIKENDQKLDEIQRQQQLKLKQELEQKVEQSQKNTKTKVIEQEQEPEQILFSDASEEDQQNSKKNSNQKKQKEEIIADSSEPSEEEEDEDDEEEEKQQNDDQNNENNNNNDIEKFSSDSESEEEQKQSNPSLTNSQIVQKSGQKILKLFTKDMLKLGQDEVMRNFLTTPVVKGYQFQCYVKREKAGMNLFKQTKYHLIMDDVILMSAKKMSGKTPNFCIIQQNIDHVPKADDYKKDSIRYIGKLKGNFMANKFTMYDTGLNKKKTKNPELYRKELGFIAYENSILDAAVPTKMVCLLPLVDFKTHIQTKEFLGQTKEDSLKELYKQKQYEDVKFLYNKPPLYNTVTKTYYLDFGNRIKKQSVKNYQLIDQISDTNIYLTSGRSDNNDLFVCDFQFPFSPIQAFCVCLAGLTYKP